MSKRCELTGKSPLHGHRVSHANNKVKRKFFPNLKNVTFKSNMLKRNIRLSVSNAALRTVDYMGGIDFYYTLLMSQREVNNYEVYHWFPATRSRYLIHPNLNLLIDPDNPVTQMKHDLLIDKRFRQALSYAINRQQVIDIVYNGVGEPAQLSPGRESYFHHEKLHKNFTEYAPEKADQLLDMIGLTKRDSEGYRTFKDGTRMIWDYSLPVGEDEGPTELIIEDWGRVGIRAIRRSPSLPLFWTQQNARQLEIYFVLIE